MSFLHGDDVLNGIKRGAEKFGSASAMKAVKKMAKRLNNYVTDSQEPYGLGMGGGDTEQMSQKTTFVPAKENVKIGIPAAQARQKNKLDFLKRELPLSQDAAERAAIEYEIKAIEAELLTMPGGDQDARQEKGSTISNEDSAALGYQSAQKTTTAQRADYSNESTLETAADWDATSPADREHDLKSAGVSLEYAKYDWDKLSPQIKSALVKATKIENSAEMKSKCPACGHESPDEWNGKCANCLMPNAEDVGKKMGRSVNNLKNANKLCASCGDSLIEGATEIGGKWYCEKCAAKKENSTEAETGSSSETKDDVVIAHESLRSNAGNKCPECGVLVRLSQADENGKRTHECPQCHQKWDNRDLTNAGHLGPDAWTAASLEERARWLELAHQDVNQAPRAWQDLSADLHVALQDVHDKPATANLDPKATDAEIKNGAGDSLKGGPCSCGHAGSRHFDTGHGEACHDCSCNVYDETIRCRKCGQKERAGLAVGGLCEECQNSKENATGKPGKKKFLFKDVQGEEEEVEAASLDQAWALLADIFGEPADALKKIGVKFVRENADSEGDLSEIARHAEGIEHEVTELKEEGLENGNKWSGKKCPLCAGPVSEHPARPYGGSPFCKACGEVLDLQDLKNELDDGLANCAGNCGCKPADHIPDAAGAFKCPCDCAECAMAKKSHAKQNDSVDSLEMKNSGVTRGNFKYGSKNK